MATSFERMKARREKLGIAAPAPRTAEQTAQTQLHNANLAQSLAAKGAPTTVQGTTTSVVNPRTQNTLSFQTGTSPAQPVQRPVTPAPVSNTGITAPTAQTDAERALFIKLQKGEALNDADYGTLYDIQKKRQTEGINSQRAAYDAIIAKQTEQRKAEEERVKAREQELRQTTEGRVQLYKEAQEAQGALEKQRAERTANENLATSERLLGARGNLTSAVGYQNARDLENERAATLNAIDSRVAAQVALYEAQLQGADDETLKEMNKRVNELYDAEQEAILTAETNLQNLKLTAQQAGDQALMDLVASAQTSLDKKKVESSYSKDITEAISDGYLYGVDADGTPVRLKDSEGNAFKTGESTGKDRYINAGGDIFDVSTGEYVSGVPQRATSGGGRSGGGSTGGVDYGTPSDVSVSTEVVDKYGKKIKLTAAQVDAVAGFDTALQQIQEAKPLLSDVNTGPISGRVSEVARLFNADDPRRVELDAKFSNIKANFLKAISGAAVSESEVKRLSKFLPSINDTEQVVAIKVKELENAIQIQKKNYLATLGAKQPQKQNVVVTAPDGQEVIIID